MLRPHSSVLAVLAAFGVSAVAGCRPTAPASPAAEAAPVSLALDRAKMAANLEIFADDAYKGRYSGDAESIGAAARFLADHHRAAGVGMAGESYLHEFELSVGRRPGSSFHIWVERDGESSAVTAEGLLGVAVGEERVAQGEIALVLGSPSAAVKDRVALLVDVPGEHLDHLAARLTAVAEAGGRGAIVVGRPGAPLPDAENARAQLEQTGLPTSWTTAEAATAWLPAAVLDVTRKRASNAADHTAVVKGLHVSMAQADEQIMARAPNVVAVLPGTDLAHELVVVGAHYDHIGTTEKGTFCRVRGADKTDTICNGADDNASGTVVVLAIAAAMRAGGYTPRRTLVFAHFAGEELGLWGSKALANHPPNVPPFVGGTVVAMLNMDMIGRLGENGVDVGGMHTSDAWTALLAASAPPGLKVNATNSMTGRSDHASYNALGVPVLFFFTGLHSEYHTTADEISLVNLEGIAKIGTLVMEVTRRLGDGAALPRKAPDASKAPPVNASTTTPPARGSDTPDRCRR